jgi:hypothetical protein
MQALAPGLAGTEAVMPERHAAFDL